jgi:hypothetical protein
LRTIDDSDDDKDEDVDDDGSFENGMWTIVTNDEFYF